MNRIAAFLLAFAFAVPASAQEPTTRYPKVLPLRTRADLRDAWVRERLDTLVPDLMRREKVDCWIISCREYNEDPLFWSMRPSRWLNARRRTILFFFDRGAEGVERLSVSRYAVGDLFEAAWDKEEQPDQWARLAELVAERNPQRIALNYSPTFATADGLTFTEMKELVNALPRGFADRVVPGENLAVGWLETRIAAEMERYPEICALAHAIIAEGFSSKVVHPGITTTHDVQWWYRERIAELKLETWFHPSVSVQRRDESSEFLAQNTGEEDPIIRPGDLLHVDFGITYLGLNTDTQWHAYVPLPGEKLPVQALEDAMQVGNRLQDILTAQFAEGRTGNEVLAATLAQAQEEGIDPLVYTHPLGHHGHGSGPTIGLWDQQGGVPGNGDYPLHRNTAYSIELSVQVELEGWTDPVRIMLEEDAFFNGKTVKYMDGRQTRMRYITGSGAGSPTRD